MLYDAESGAVVRRLGRHKEHVFNRLHPAWDAWLVLSLSVSLARILLLNDFMVS